MGYYTRHKLSVIDGEHALIAELVAENEDAACAIDENGETEERCKWYSHQEDMKCFSLKHPDVLFRLDGEGEESGDIWAEYYKGGKMQVCKAEIVIPDFNEDLLK